MPMTNYRLPHARVLLARARPTRAWTGRRRPSWRGNGRSTFAPPSTHYTSLRGSGEETTIYKAGEEDNGRPAGEVGLF